ncbi:MAG TPA: CYTH domain-containing protein [Candidatus Anaerofilum excrementigallinarum]|nr:CYTH domain-containing protein [Candidatus Anaerofilum excrementigallinarum]
MEIERKWLTQGWPQGQPDRVIEMEQGYISVSPTVRIRSHRETGKADRYVLCFKSKGGLVRQEIETDIDKALFDQLRDFIGKPLVKKVQRRYNLPGGLVLEANQVDPGQPTGFFYAEVEFASEADALAWQPVQGLAGYLQNEVTDQPGESMGAYWLRTRGE